MGDFPYPSLLLGNLTNKNYKGNLVQVIDIDVRDTIDLNKGVVITINIIQKSTQNNIQDFFEIVESGSVTQLKCLG